MFAVDGVSYAGPKVFCTVSGASQGGVNYGNKYYNYSDYVVRPVLAF